MLDAVRMCGHWISKGLLERITARTLGLDPPTRQELLKEFCRRTQWRNGKGDLCLSSANVCVKRLEEQGLVRLPPAAARAPRLARRTLLDDGLPLPPLPKLPRSVEQIPDLHFANLASRCYRLVLQRVRTDWFDRYGVRPVLVETYVDRSTYTGKSLAAANWLRIGQSLGRGRTSPGKQARPQSVKDVWVWQWADQARARLQERTLPAVVPRSIFRHSQQECWVQEELDGLDLGHRKLQGRFAQMLQDRWAHPDWSFYTSFGGGAGGKAAYAFIENRRAEL